MSEQRAEFQFSLFKYNLAACGTLVGFALSPDHQYQHAFLIVPVVSFTLFSLWVHHALVIRLSKTDTYLPSPHTSWEWLRRLTFSVSILMNFALIPAGALLLYEGDELRSLQVVDIGLIVMIFIMYVSWFYLQYIKKGGAKSGE